jgi:hypothetical protein
MTTRLLKANPAVSEDRGRVAFQRGPIVFCMEHPDQPERGQDVALTDYAVDLHAATTSHFEPHLLDGVMVLDHPAVINRTPESLGLYYPATDGIHSEQRPATIKLIPYYAWANRGPAAMQVWIPYTPA